MCHIRNARGLRMRFGSVIKAVGRGCAEPARDSAGQLTELRDWQHSLLALTTLWAFRANAVGNLLACDTSVTGRRRVGTRDWAFYTLAQTESKPVFTMRVP